MLPSDAACDYSTSRFQLFFSVHNPDSDSKFTRDFLVMILCFILGVYSILLGSTCGDIIRKPGYINIQTLTSILFF